MFTLGTWSRPKTSQHGTRHLGWAHRANGQARGVGINNLAGALKSSVKLPD